SASRSAPAAADGTIGVPDKTKITSSARRILIPRRSNQQGADSRIAPRRPYSTQTALSNRVGKSCQLFARPPVIATIHRNKTYTRGQRVPRGGQQARDASHL